MGERGNNSPDSGIRDMKVEAALRPNILSSLNILGSSMKEQMDRISEIIPKSAREEVEWKGSSMFNDEQPSKLIAQPTMEYKPSRQYLPTKRIMISGRWSQLEHKNFVDSLRKYGKDWKKVEDCIKTRSGAQIRSHAQKFFNRIQKEFKTEEPLEFILNNPENLVVSKVEEPSRDMGSISAELRPAQRIEHTKRERSNSFNLFNLSPQLIDGGGDSDTHTKDKIIENESYVKQTNWSQFRPIIKQQKIIEMKTEKTLEESSKEYMILHEETIRSILRNCNLIYEKAELENSLEKILLLSGKHHALYLQALNHSLSQPDIFEILTNASGEIENLMKIMLQLNTSLIISNAVKGYMTLESVGITNNNNNNNNKEIREWNKVENKEGFKIVSNNVEVLEETLDIKDRRDIMEGKASSFKPYSLDKAGSSYNTLSKLRATSFEAQNINKSANTQGDTEKKRFKFQEEEEYYFTKGQSYIIRLFIFLMDIKPEFLHFVKFIVFAY